VTPGATSSPAQSLWFFVRSGIFAGSRASTGTAMLDIIFLALGIAGFAVCLGYVHLCDRL
jgi:hypothetical protein